jgi:protoporphyrinogen oxidase
MHVGIIGGGITGLTTAYYLLKAGHRATVFEAAPMLGGLATAVQVQGVWVDKFYHCILPSDTALLDLMTDLGLGDHIYWQETEMGFLYRGRLYPLTTPLDLLRFSALSLTDRFRLGILGLYSRRLKDWQALERITAKEWLTKFCGEKVFNVVWKPMLTFKFGNQYNQVPATYLWSRVKRQATTRKDRSQKELLAYVKGGFKKIITQLAQEVQKLGGEIIHHRVEGIKTQNHQVRGIVLNGELHAFDKVVCTAPIEQFLKLIDTEVLGDGFRYHSISYQGVVCVLLVLKERLSRYYWMPVVESDLSCGAIMETTNLIRREDLGGISLVYLVNYVPSGHPLFSASERELISRSIAGLEKIFPHFHSSQVLEAHVHKAALVEPVWTLNYSSKLPHRTLLNNSLFLLTTAQLYPNINSTSNCVKQVNEIFKQLVAENDPT